MKKQFYCLVLALVSIVLFSGCRNNQPKDGTYRAELSDKATEDNLGWREYMEITYKDGDITDVAYDGIDADGRIKSTLTKEEYPMDPHPSEWIEKMKNNIKRGKTADKMEGIAGATRSSRNARLLMKHIEKSAAEGDTSTAIVETAS